MDDINQLINNHIQRVHSRQTLDSAIRPPEVFDTSTPSLRPVYAGLTDAQYRLDTLETTEPPHPHGADLIMPGGGGGSGISGEFELVVSVEWTGTTIKICKDKFVFSNGLLVDHIEHGANDYPESESCKEIETTPFPGDAYNCDDDWEVEVEGKYP